MTDEIGIKLVGKGWYKRLKGTLNSPEFDALGKFLASERSKFKIYPKKEDVFRAFIATPFSKVKIVILGQDLEKFNIETTINKQNVITVRSSSYDLFINLVDEFVLPSMKYKYKLRVLNKSDKLLENPEEDNQQPITTLNE